MIGRCRREIALEHIRRDRVIVLRIGRHHPERPGLAAAQPMLAHQATDALVIKAAAQRLADLWGHTPAPVPPAVLALRAPDLLDDALLGLGALPSHRGGASPGTNRFATPQAARTSSESSTSRAAP